jgi:hypothetical protein
MPTTFNVISLGKTRDIDRKDGNVEAEKADKLVGKSFGDKDDPLFKHIQQMTPSDDGLGKTDYYDQDNSEDNGFHIDGGAVQTFDAVAVYEAVITYDDGTTAKITAVIFQDVDGNTYLAPEISKNADQVALDAKPIVSLDLTGLVGSASLGLAGDRAAGNFAPCFTPGARISVPGGARLVESLRPGDLVLTADHGAQPICWIGDAVVRAAGAMVPVRIARGALGGGLPRRDLLVSPQHRMVLRSRIAARMMHRAEVFVPAKKLVGLPGIAPDHSAVAVRYIHLLLPAHEVIFAEGAPTESLLPGPQSMAALAPEGRAEIIALFPDLPHHAPDPARAIPKGRLIRSLIARHRANGRPVLHAVGRSGHRGGG